MTQNLQRPTVYNAGVSSQPPNFNLHTFRMIDPAIMQTMFDDFMFYQAALYTITANDSGAVTNPAAAGGTVLLTTGTTSTDLVVMQNAVCPFVLTAGQKMWFRVAFKASDVLLSRLQFGMVNAVTTQAPTDGIWINKTSSATPVWTLNYADVADSVTSTTILTLPAALVNATYVTMGFVFNGVDTVAVYLNDQYFTQIVIGTKLTGVLLAPAVSISAGASAAKTMTVDHLLGAVERPLVFSGF